MNLTTKKFDLEDRLIAFASQTIKIVDAMPKGIAARHLAGQLVRSSTSPALNYAEASGAESQNDFTHKMSLVLKELKGALVCLRIIEVQMYLSQASLRAVIKECHELVLITAKIVRSSRENTSRSYPPSNIKI